MYLESKKDELVYGTYVKLRREKIKPMSYYLVHPDPSIGRIVRVDKTGETGRDTYPWDWYMLHGLDWVTRGRRYTVRSMGNDESLKAIVETVETLLNYEGLDFTGYREEQGDEP
jgi:hypothetical protein